MANVPAERVVESAEYGVGGLGGLAYDSELRSFVILQFGDGSGSHCADDDQ